MYEYVVHSKDPLSPAMRDKKTDKDSISAQFLEYVAY